jgi:integrase/recombinase XerD
MNPREIYSPQFKAIESDFINWLQTLGYSQATMDTRKRNIKEFLLYLERCNINTVEQITSYKIKLFTKYLKRRENKLSGSGLANASINVGISTVNKFVEYLWQSRKMITTINKLEHVEEHYKPRNILTLKEMNALYEATFYKSHNTREGTRAIHEAVSQRDRVMLGIYYGCGMRKSEGINLQVKDILTERKLVFVRKGKGCKERYVPITGGNLHYIIEYLHNAREYLLSKAENRTEALFINQSGMPCRAEALSTRLGKLVQRSDNSSLHGKKPTLHTLRHSIATHLLQQGMDIEMIQQFLGHATMETTQIYTHILNEI